MDLLYLSPEFPPNFANFIYRLNANGVNVWALGEADFYYMPESLRSALKYYCRTDLNNLATVENSLESLLMAKSNIGFSGPFHIVESHNEQWLNLEAFINEKYAIPGIKTQDLERLKKKSIMKQIFRDSGLRVAKGGPVGNYPEALALAKTLSYPLILKPDEGVGASGIHKIENDYQLENILKKYPGIYTLEEFIDGPIFSFDGLTDYNGRILFQNSLVYGEGVLEYVLGKDTFFYVNQDIPKNLVQIGRKLVHTFDVRRKFFHFEFFKTKDGYIPIEINCRPPGGPILDMMNYSADVDLYAAYADMIVQNPVELPIHKKYYCAYVGRRHRDYIHTHEDILNFCGEKLVEFGENPPVFQEAMCPYRYIIRSQSQTDLIDMAKKIIEL